MVNFREEQDWTYSVIPDFVQDMKDQIEDLFGADDVYYEDGPDGLWIVHIWYEDELSEREKEDVVDLIPDVVEPYINYKFPDKDGGSDLMIQYNDNNTLDRSS